jgi:cytochrome c-type biogenesis protein CcmH/NrfF
LPRRLRRFSPKLAVVFCLCLAALFAQDPAAEFSPSVLKVGSKLACRCSGCRNTIGDCPMLHCESASPMRQRIARMQGQGMNDDAIVAAIVKQEGVVALASPPATGFGLFTWVMPGIALVLGFFVYQRWVRRNQKAPAPLTTEDQAMIDRYRTQIDRELEP